MEIQVNFSAVDNLCRMTSARCNKVASQDAKLLSSSPAKFVKSNSLTYFLAINTWLLQAVDIDERIALDIEAAIESMGLIRVIAQCCECADSVIRDTNPDVPQFLSYAYRVLAQRKQEFLQLLRYLKRFSPSDADILKTKTLNAFIQTNKRMKSINKYDNYHYSSKGPDTPVFGFMTSEASMNPKILHDIRGVIADILEGHYHVDFSRDCMFSSGSCSDAKPILASKLQACRKVEQYFPAPFYALTDCDKVDRVTYYADILAVNKSYKSSRIIGKEAALRQYYMQAVRKAIERAIEISGYSNRISIHDQTVNRERCREGSIDGSLATIDLSSASDSISVRLAYSVLPAQVVADVDRLRSRFLRINGKEIPSDIFLTAGQAPTFVLESIIFYAIAQTATDYYCVLTGDTAQYPSVYGDDLVVDKKVFDFLCQILTNLGFIVNNDKSFGQYFYRESCGAEYEFGRDLATRYYPRKTIGKDVESLSSIIDLQHKLYYSWRCRYFLDRIVNTIIPGMTSHYPGTACSDLWSDTPIFQRAYAPTEGKIVDHEYHCRERHYVLVQKEPKELPAQLDRCFLDRWYYYKYLTEGPKYSDPLLELLGVSTSRRQYAIDYGITESTWLLKIE